MDLNPAQRIKRTCDFRIVWASFDVLVAELDRNSIFSGRCWQVRDGHCAIFVIVTTDVSLAGTFHSQRETTYNKWKDN